MEERKVEEIGKDIYGYISLVPAKFEERSVVAIINMEVIINTRVIQ